MTSYGYEIPGVSSFEVHSSPVAARLLRAGVVHATTGPGGHAFLGTSKAAFNRSLYGEPTKTVEGWAFYPPAVVGTIETLAGPLAAAPGNHQVPLRLGGFLTIRPAYLDPRLVFSGGVAEDHPTHYGRIARALRDRIRNGEELDLGSPEVIAVVQAAILSVYPVTPELLDVVNRVHPFLTDDDLQPILTAAFTAPFLRPAAAG